ncbi:hypothetical protein C8F01DRAFT_1274667 [Mycena amicta]|nr:hypothetical protein C8F01DRAFT_1274667 [Mycena amicta]
MSLPVPQLETLIAGPPGSDPALPIAVIDRNPTPESTHDVECPKARPYMFPTPIDPLPTLADMVPRSVVFTRGPFPRIQIHTPRILHGLGEDQRTRVRNNPEDYLAVIPHGATSRLFSLQPGLQGDIVDFLATLGFQGNKASYRLERSTTTGYDQWCMILSGVNDEMKRYLTWQQTFAISRELTFHVVPFLARRRRHDTICTFEWHNPAMDDSPATRLKLLTAVREKMQVSQRFIRENAEVMREAGYPGDDRALALRAATLLQIHYAPGDENHFQMMILTTRSLAKNEFRQGKWARMVSTVVIDSVTVDGTRLFRGPRWFRCRWCKSVFHFSESCNFERVPGWLGSGEHNPPQALVDE